MLSGSMKCLWKGMATFYRACCNCVLYNCISYRHSTAVAGRASEPEQTERGALFHTLWNNQVAKLIPTCLTADSYEHCSHKTNPKRGISETFSASQCGLTMLTLLSIFVEQHVGTTGSQNREVTEPSRRCRGPGIPATKWANIKYNSQVSNFLPHHTIFSYESTLRI